MSLTVSPEVRGEATVVTVTGELDLATAPQLQSELDQLTENGQVRLIFDLSGLEFCDSTGLAVLVRVRNRTEAAGGGIALAAPGHGVQRILEISGLNSVMPTYPDLETALSEVGSSSLRAQ